MTGRKSWTGLWNIFPEASEGVNGGEWLWSTWFFLKAGNQWQLPQRWDTTSPVMRYNFPRYYWWLPRIVSNVNVNYRRSCKSSHYINVCGTVYVIDHVIGWVNCRLGPIGDQDFENYSGNCHCGQDVMIVVKKFLGLSQKFDGHGGLSAWIWEEPDPIGDHGYRCRHVSWGHCHCGDWGIFLIDWFSTLDWFLITDWFLIPAVFS